MIIKKIGCDQFAGVTDKEFTLSDGMNVLVGPNETGKSTMVDLMYHTLFEDVKVRRGGDFQSLYFPKKASGYAGDCIDGELSFETPDGLYRLRKEWETRGGNCRLTLPNGTVIRDNDTVNRILAEKLVYGKGVYDEMVFASQKRALTILQSLFQDAALRRKTDASDVRGEISATVTKAVMETGGISLDKLESRLNALLAQYSERWDFAADMPEGGKKRGIENKWACATSDKAARDNLAIILRAYYAKEELADLQRKARSAEIAVEEANDSLTAAKNGYEAAKAAREDFLKYSNVLTNRNLLLAGKANAERALSQLVNDAAAWPAAADREKKAKDLRTALDRALCRELYEEIMALQENLERQQAASAALCEIPEEDVMKAQRLERELERLRARLQGMNLTAKIRQLGAVAPEVRSAADGAEIPIRDGEFRITEAVSICLPELLELKLMPAGVDVDAVESQIADKSADYAALLEKYGAADAEALRTGRMNKERLKAEISRLEDQIRLRLNGQDPDELKDRYLQLTGERQSSAAVKRAIVDLCGRESVDAFIGRQGGIIAPFLQQYGTPDQLQQKIEDKRAEIEDYQDRLSAMQDIPDEFLSITDTAAHDKKLKQAVDAGQVRIDMARNLLAEKERQLGDRTAEEYQDLLTEKTEEFENQKAVYYRWKHIAEVVQQVKAASAGNPMQDIEDKFGKYLTILTKGSLKLGSLSEKLDTSITSGSNQLTYSILSAGTKDTILLAFRLAVLEHLFPDGGGLAVLDDPFTDMDAGRKALACELVKEFAKTNQVIFVTCDSDYIGRLGGSVIEFS